MVIFNVFAGFSTTRGWKFSLKWCCMWGCSDLQCKMILGGLIESVWAVSKMGLEHMLDLMFYQ